MGTKHFTGARGCRLRANRHGYLSVHLHYVGFPGRKRWSEGTGLQDTAKNRAELQRKICEPISAEMRAGRFTPERYLFFFAYGSRAPEFRIPTTDANTGEIPTIAEYFADWIQLQRPPLVRPAQQRDYAQHFDCYLLHAAWGHGRVFGDLQLSEVRPRIWYQLRDHLLALDLKPKTVKNILGSLRTLVRDAMKRTDHIQGNPFAQLKWQRSLPDEPDPFDEAERDRIITWFKTRKPHYHPFVLTLLFTGMRPSEASALRWSDIDLARSALRVRRSRYHGAESAPKTRGSERTVYLLPIVRNTLRRALARGAGPDDYVFTNEVTGGPIDQGEWAREFWHRPLTELEIKPRKFYATRHTFISIALTKGVNMKWLAEQCGNSVGTIERHYGKFLVGEAEAQLRLLDPSVGRDLAKPASTAKGKRKVQTLEARFALSAEKPLRNKVVPTGIEPVFPT